MNKYSIVFFMLTSILFSQNPNLKISQVKTAGDSVTYQLDLSLTGVQLADDGMMILLPADASGVITGMAIGSNNFWLKNSDEIPTVNDVVHWENVENRLIVRFLRAQVQDADDLIIRITSQFPRSFRQPEAVSIHQLAGFADPNDQGRSIITSTNLQIIE